VLERVYEEEGVRVEVDMLIGPDNVWGDTEEDQVMPLVENVNVVTSDVAREWWVNKREEGREDFGLRRLSGCGGWELMKTVDEAGEGETSVWRTCRAEFEGWDDLGVYFVESPEDRDEISSTALREMMRRCSEDEREMEEDPLWKKIMGHEILKDMIMKHQREDSEARRAQKKVRVSSKNSDCTRG
jgi:hypothetical protein